MEGIADDDNTSSKVTWHVGGEYVAHLIMIVSRDDDAHHTTRIVHTKSIPIQFVVCPSE